MIESLLIAGLTGLVAGALMLGKMHGEVRASTRAIKALHARFDGLMLALSRFGVVPTGATAHLARARAREDEAFRKEGVPREA